MKTNPEHNAFPVVVTAADATYSTGLTKREYFAAMAMQGIIANPNIEISYDELAESSVRQAECLIDELNKKE